jgi:hypothetical protein
MEGSFDMIEEFGSIPETIYVAAIAYATPDGGGVNAQAPSATVANNNLEPAEFLAIPVGQIRDSDMDGTYNILSPEDGFMIRSFELTPSGNRQFNWQVIPGLAFQLDGQTNNPGDTWKLLNAQTAAAGQWQMSFTDTNSATPLQMYRLSRP